MQASKQHSPSVFVFSGNSRTAINGHAAKVTNLFFAVSHSKTQADRLRHAAVCGMTAKVFGRVPPAGDRISSPQGESTAGELTNLFSFQELLCKPFVSFCFHNRYGRIPPAARSACPQNLKLCLLNRSHPKIVHWTALLSSKFSKV